MAEKSKLWDLENFNLFKGLKKDSMVELNKISSMRELKKEDRFTLQTNHRGQYIFLKPVE